MWPLAQPDLLGPLKMVTAPTGLVVDVDRAKLHCRADSDHDAEDQLFEAWILAAQREVQRLTNRQLLQATYDLPLAGFWSGPLKLPRAPLSSVTSVSYYDTGGTLTALASTYYEVHTPADQPGWIIRAPDLTWPSVRADKMHPAVIRFVAGYGASGQSVPETIQHALLLLVDTKYQRRAPTEQEWLAIRSLLEMESWGAYA